MSGQGRRIAVVLFNLGGPPDQVNVRPFLQNLFSDPAIIGLPAVVRAPLARLIAKRREAAAQANYALMGGGSPLLAETQAQARALEASLARHLPGDETQVFVAMRYWAPLTEEAARKVEAFAPDEVVLVPLYPQFSTTTTASSLKRWAEVYRGSGASRAVCCYPESRGFVEAQAEAVRETLARAADRPVRVLFSAHGIPERLVTAKGDPYQAQVEQTCRAVAQAAGLTDWTICYQSRVGPLKWLGPSTPEAIEAAGRDGLGVVIVPVAFVSEHVETLVELDIEYAELAHGVGVTPYLRAPTVKARPAFIEGLAAAVGEALARPGVAPSGPGCEADFAACPFRGQGRRAA